MPMYSHILAPYVNPVFIETGTDWGHTVEIALKLGFSRVISIEADLQKWCLAKERFSSNVSVEIVHGDSGLVLWELIQSIDAPITFWLDGHEPQTPILAELAAIRRHPINTHTILVDDMRIFRAKVAWAAVSNVDEAKVRQEILNINPEYDLLYQDTDFIKDILVARPRMA